MKNRVGVQSRIAVAGMSGIAALVIALVALTSIKPAKAASSGSYHQTNLVSDVPGLALILDPDLVNPWGISMSGGSPFWVSNNGSGTSTLYAGDHLGGSPLTKNPLVVTIPGGGFHPAAVAPDLCAQTALAFLRDVDGAAGAAPQAA